MDSEEENNEFLPSSEDFARWSFLTFFQWKCELCGCEYFDIHVNSKEMPYQLEVPVAMGPDTTTRKSHPFYFLICNNCGNTKFLARHVVNESIKREKEIHGAKE